MCVFHKKACVCRWCDCGTGRAASVLAASRFCHESGVPPPELLMSHVDLHSLVLFPTY